jgi:hypothetical protein
VNDELERNMKGRDTDLVGDNIPEFVSRYSRKL